MSVIRINRIRQVTRAKYVIDDGDVTTGLLELHGGEKHGFDRNLC